MTIILQKVLKKLSNYIYVYGEGFSEGRRNENYIKDYANFLSQRGYIVTSIYYRLTVKNKGFGCNINATEKVIPFQNTPKDILKALRYILRKKESLK